MGNRELAGKLLLAVATAGLTTCDGVGAVDPAPEPMNCGDYDKGQGIQFLATLEGSNLDMAAQSYPWAAKPDVTAVNGLMIGGVQLTDNKLAIHATLGAGVTTASFTVEGDVTDGEVTCAVSRTFTVTVTGTDVQVAEVYDLPLSPRRHASIEVLGRDGLDVELRASGAVRGTRVTWTPTGGAVRSAGEGRTRWTLPSEPGVYQVEMLVDRGDDGFSHDTLTLEVLG